MSCHDDNQHLSLSRLEIYQSPTTRVYNTYLNRGASKAFFRGSMGLYTTMHINFTKISSVVGPGILNVMGSEVGENIAVLEDAEDDS